MTVRRDELAQRRDALGLWRHLPEQIRAANIVAVAQGGHPWATQIAADVPFFADGEELAEGGVDAFPRTTGRASRALGGRLTVATFRHAKPGPRSYPSTANQSFCYDQSSWDSNVEAEHPWVTSTVRPLAVVNRLLGKTGAVERFFTLYTGGNDGLAFLIDPHVVDELRHSGISPGELPVEAK